MKNHVVIEDALKHVFDNSFYDLEGNSQSEMDNGIHPDAAGLRIRHLFHGGRTLALVSGKLTGL